MLRDMNTALTEVFASTVLESTRSAALNVEDEAAAMLRDARARRKGCDVVSPLWTLSAFIAMRPRRVGLRVRLA
jgi:hypothetical protein